MYILWLITNIERVERERERECDIELDIRTNVYSGVTFHSNFKQCVMHVEINSF